MPATPSPQEEADAISAAAAAWLARRDRGLSPAEQDTFLQWLREEPRHRAALANLDRTWSALDALTEWHPKHSSQPNPDLLACAARPRWRRARFTTAALAVAASIALGLFLTLPTAPPSPGTPRGLRVIPAPSSTALADGSVVTANQGGAYELAFSPGERRVRLLAGEVHFQVAKDSARPFVVEVSGVAVRAIGTAFDVRRSAQAVDILVTEGRVQVESPAAPAGNLHAASPVPLGAGQQATVDPALPSAAPLIVTLSPAQIEHALAWQAVRLDFDELPLAAVVAEFNRRNRQQMVIADSRIAGLRVAGSFRADNVEAFARLLEASFGVSVESRPDGALVLRRAGS